MKNRYKVLLLLIIIITVNSAFAQDTTQRKHLIFKIVPLTMFDIDNTFQIATEHNLLKNLRWTLSEEIGYGTGQANIWANSNTNSGSYGPYRELYRVKVEARKYQKGKPQMTGTYVAYEVFYKQMNDKIKRSVGRDCDGGNCNYFENIDYPVSKYVVGGTVKIGYQNRIQNENNKKSNFVFDFYVGLGLRRVMIDHRIDGEAQNNSWFFGNDAIFSNGGFGYRDRAYNIPHASFGIRFGYIIF